MHRAFVTITEVPKRGWLVKEFGRYYKSAAAASKVVRLNYAVMKSIIVITWEPVSAAGRLVVDSIIAADEKLY